MALVISTVAGDQESAGQISFRALVQKRINFLDACLSPEERHMARLQEIEKLEEVFKAFTPRDGRALPPNIRVFNHVWVDKKSYGVAKSRLTGADVNRKQTP